MPLRCSKPVLRRDAFAAIDERRQLPGVRDDTHGHGFVAAADRDLLLWQRIVGKAGGAADFLRDDRFAGQCLGHVLEPGRDVDGIAQRREDDVIAIADVTDDDLAAMDADAEADRLA